MTPQFTPQMLLAQNAQTDELKKMLESAMGIQTPGSVAQMQKEQRIPATQAATSPLSAPQQVEPVDTMKQKVSYSGSILSPQQEQERQAIMAQLAAAQEQNQADQRAGIDDYQKAMGEYQTQELQYDLRPLASVIDAVSGSNTYKLATDMITDTPETKRQKLMQMKEKLQGLKGSVSKDQLAYLKEQLDQYNDLIKLEKMAEASAMAAGRQARFESAQDMKKEDTIRKDVNKIADEYKSTQEQLNVADSAVDAGDTRGIQMIISSIARNVGEQKGALSDGDVARSLPPDIATSVAGLQAYLGSTATISPELQGALRQLISRARQKSNMIYEESLGRRRSQYSAGAYAPLMQQQRVGDVIFKEAEMLKPQEQAPSGPSGFLSPQEWLKKKRGQ